MDLDNLRRRWQEQSTHTPPVSLTEQKLRAMLTNQTEGPIARMRRNATRDLRILLLLLSLNIFNVINLMKRHGAAEVRALFVALLVLMMAFVAWNTVAKLRIIKQLQSDSGAVYLHLRSQLQRIRRLIRLHRYAVVVFLTSLATISAYSQRNKLVHNVFTDAIDWPTTILVVAVVAMIILLLFVGQHRQQRRYGKYLDQMDAALRELEDERR